MRHFFLASALAMTLLANTASAGSTPTLTCAPRADIVKKLDSEFNEKQTAVGLVNENAVIEIFVSPKATWTIIATGVDGKSCLLSAGQDWQSILMSFPASVQN